MIFIVMIGICHTIAVTERIFRCIAVQVIFISMLINTLLAALASVVATGYLATLWWLEWRDDA